MTDKSAPEQVELLACPWCQGKAVEPVGPSLGCPKWRVICDDCGAEGPPAGDSQSFDDGAEAEAIAAWNNRIQSQRPSPGVDVDLVERVAEAIARCDPGNNPAQARLYARAAIASMPDERKLIEAKATSDLYNALVALGLPTYTGAASEEYRKAHQAGWEGAIHTVRNLANEVFRRAENADAIERGQHISATVEG